MEYKHADISLWRNSSILNNTYNQVIFSITILAKVIRTLNNLEEAKLCQSNQKTNYIWYINLYITWSSKLMYIYLMSEYSSPTWLWKEVPLQTHKRKHITPGTDFIVFLKHWACNKKINMHPVNSEPVTKITWVPHQLHLLNC